jgi:hypothetical protein
MLNLVKCFFIIDLIFATIDYGGWFWDQEVEHLSVGLIFKGMKNERKWIIFIHERWIKLHEL